MKQSRISRYRVLALFASCALALLLAACGGQAQSARTSDTSNASSPQATSAPSDAADDTAPADYQKPGDDYRLEQVVVLSRHNIRAPLSTNGSALAKATPNQWIAWTAEPSELTLPAALAPKRKLLPTCTLTGCVARSRTRSTNSSGPRAASCVVNRSAMT